MNAIQKLRQTVGEIRTSKQPAQLHAAWELAIRLLGRMPVNVTELQAISQARDVDGLDRLVTKLENPSAPPPPASQDSLSPEMKRDMESALRAFRKRLKLMRLDDESRIGNRQLTGGRKSEIDAIIPPNEFPSHVWQMLAKTGQLKSAGGGFYELPPEDPRAPR
jgi:hypothetical protein